MAKISPLRQRPVLSVYRLPERFASAMPPLKRFILVGGWAFGLGCLCLPALLADLAAAEVAGFEAPTAKSVQARMATAKADSTLLDRLIYLSDPFVGAPYVVSPLGEGAGEDTDPRIRFDAFDCTTFVETTMALLFFARPGRGAGAPQPNSLPRRSA